MAPASVEIGPRLDIKISLSNALAELFERTASTVADLVRLVDDLLDMSRISRGKLHLRKERITIEAAVNHALELCGQVVSEGGHELSVALPEEQIFLHADKARLAQTLSNLVLNAAKYSEPGSRISLTVERQGTEAIISVKDTGNGIPPHMLSGVFQMFMQVDRSLEKSQGGLGVGLALVKRLVEMHGGSALPPMSACGSLSDRFGVSNYSETVRSPNDAAQAQ